MLVPLSCKLLLRLFTTHIILAAMSLPPFLTPHYFQYLTPRYFNSPHCHYFSSFASSPFLSSLSLTHTYSILLILTSIPLLSVHISTSSCPPQPALCCHYRLHVISIHRSPWRLQPDLVYQPVHHHWKEERD